MIQDWYNIFISDHKIGSKNWA